MRIAIKKCGKLFVHWSHLGAPSLEAPVSSPLRFHSGDIYSFLFLLSVHLRPKFSFVSLNDHTQSMENLWVPGGLVFPQKADLLLQFFHWRRGCPPSPALAWLEQQGWSSRTFPCPGWRFLPALFRHWRRLFCLSSTHLWGFQMSAQGWCEIQPGFIGASWCSREKLQIKKLSALWCRPFWSWGAAVAT